MSRTKQPTHYGERPDVIDFAYKYNLSFPLANAVKYIARAGKKQGEPIEKDLNKAIDCIKRELEQMQPEPVAAAAAAKDPKFIGAESLKKTALSKYKRSEMIYCAESGNVYTLSNSDLESLDHFKYSNGDEHLVTGGIVFAFLYYNGKWATHV